MRSELCYSAITGHEGWAHWFLKVVGTLGVDMTMALNCVINLGLRILT